MKARTFIQMSTPSPYSLTAFVLSTAPMNCSCPSSMTHPAVHGATAERPSAKQGSTTAAADHDDSYVLLSILSCYVENLDALSTNMTVVDQLLDTLQQVLEGLPCHLNAGLGGVANGEVQFRLHDGRYVRLTVVEPVTHDEVIPSDQL